MRPITATLLAAATSRRGRPLVTVALEDHQLRWTAHVTALPSSRRTAVATRGTTLHRVRLYGTAVHYAAIANPAAPASWPGSWSSLATDADGAADVALAYHPDLLQVFYLDLDGNISRRTSTDGGASWTAAADVHAWDYAPVYIAAGGRICVISRPTEILVHTIVNDLGGPGWSAPSPWPNAFTACQGLAVAPILGETDRFYILAALDGALWSAEYDETARTWHDVTKVWPAGDGPAPEPGLARYPSAVDTPEGLLVTVVDTAVGGDLTPWPHTYLLRAKTHPHYQRVALLATGQTAPARTCLARVDNTLYAATDASALACVPYSAANASKNMAATIPLAYLLHTDERLSRLEVTIRNVAGRYHLPANPAGVPAARPLATLIVERGYRTIIGEETEPLAPHYITRATIHHGARRNDLVLEAVDARGLLDLYHPPDAARWTGRTIRWLLAHLAAACGIDYDDDGSVALGRTLPTFTQRPTDTAGTAVRALLELAGAVAWVDKDGTLQAAALATHAAAPPEIAAGAIMQAAHTVALEGATSYSLSSLDVYGTTMPDLETMDLGQLFHRAITDIRATTSAVANTQTAYLRLRQRMARNHDTIEIPLRPDLDLYDRLTVTHPPNLPAGAEARRLTGILEAWTPAAATFKTTLQTQRVPT